MEGGGEGKRGVSLGKGGEKEEWGEFGERREGGGGERSGVSLGRSWREGEGWLVRALGREEMG